MNSTGYILDGMYHTALPPLEQMKESTASTDKEYQHDRQRENHRRDLIQPYINGMANPAFIEQYPQEARGYGFIK